MPAGSHELAAEIEVASIMPIEQMEVLNITTGSWPRKHPRMKLGVQPSIPIYPESDKMFFTKVVDAELEFVTDGKGEVSAAHLASQ